MWKIKFVLSYIWNDKILRYLLLASLAIVIFMMVFVSTSRARDWSVGKAKESLGVNIRSSMKSVRVAVNNFNEHRLIYKYTAFSGRLEVYNWQQSNKPIYDYIDSRGMKTCRGAPCEYDFSSLSKSSIIYILDGIWVAEVKFWSASSRDANVANIEKAQKEYPGHYKTKTYNLKKGTYIIRARPPMPGMGNDHFWSLEFPDGRMRCIWLNATWRDFIVSQYPDDKDTEGWWDRNFLKSWKGK